MTIVSRESGPKQRFLWVPRQQTATPDGPVYGCAGVTEKGPKRSLVRAA
jgi:hypothetical protein